MTLGLKFFVLCMIFFIDMNIFRVECKINSILEILRDKKNNNDMVSKDKIKEKIRELQDKIQKEEEETMGHCITIGEEMAICYLSELLKENKQS